MQQYFFFQPKSEKTISSAWNSRKHLFSKQHVRYFEQRKKDLQEDLQQAGSEQSKITAIEDRISKLYHN